MVTIPGAGTYENRVDAQVDQPNEGGAPSATNSTVINPPPSGGGGGGFSGPSQIPPVIVLEPESFDITAIKGEASPEPQVLGVSNSAEGVTLQWTVESDSPWLTVAPSSGLGNSREVDQVRLFINTTSLEPGTHIATVSVTGPGAANSPQTAQVELTLEPALPRFGVNQDNFTFTAVRGGALPPPRNLDIQNAGGRPLEWTAEANVEWLILSSLQGSIEPGMVSPVSILVDSVNLSDGAHEATITLSAEGAANSPREVRVTVLILPPEPEIAFSQGSFTVSAARGSPNTPPQILDVWNAGGRTLNWSITDDADWLR
ncbi:MAG: BACON domain-containing protein, partial [Ardenticatenaceae bacterium]